MMTVSKKFLCDRITPIQTFKAPDKEAINGALLGLESGATLYLHPCDQCINCETLILNNKYKHPALMVR